MEIVTLFPYDGSFIRLAGRMVDPALGVAVGWNHFVGIAEATKTYRYDILSSDSDMT